MHAKLDLGILINVAKLLESEPQLIRYGPLIPINAASIYVYKVSALSYARDCEVDRRDFRAHAETAGSDIVEVRPLHFKRCQLVRFLDRLRPDDDLSAIATAALIG